MIPAGVVPLASVYGQSLPPPRGSMVEVFEKTLKDAHPGGDLWTMAGAEGQDPTMMESLDGGVVKTNPGRTFSAEDRITLDMRIQDAGGHDEEHPPALQPRPQQILRRATVWRACHPPVAPRGAKRDVARTF